MKLTDIYDPNKKGTLIIGMPRAGTHHCYSLVLNEIEKNISNIVPLGEVPIRFDNADTSAWAVASGDIPLLETIFNMEQSDKYVVCSSPSPELFFFTPELTDQFHTVKILRRNIWEHFKSSFILEFMLTNASHGVVNSAVNQDVFLAAFKTQFEIPLREAMSFVLRRRAISRCRSDFTVYYEDIQMRESSTKRSTVALSPEQIFSNFKEIDAIFRNANKLL